MPVRTGYRIPISLNPDGTTVSNVRNKTLADYASPTRTWTVTSGSVTSQGTNDGTWGQTLPTCFQLAPSTKVSSALLLSSGVFTLMMRIRIPTLASGTEMRTDAIFTNGGTRYFQLGYRYTPTDPENPVHSFEITEVASGTVTITTGVAANTWYHLAIVNNGLRFNTYVNGGSGPPLTLGEVAPWNTSSSFGLETENAEVLQLTDFVFLKKELSAKEIGNYAAAPFI